MQAMLLEKPRPVDESPLNLATLPDPKPAPGEVRVRVRCCAVCRTDLHILEADLPPARQPVIPGHQAVGVVDLLGEDCHRLKIGQRVGIAWLRHACGRCDFCRRGRENLCPFSRYSGYDADGGYAQYALVPEDYAYEIPEAFSDVDAAPLLCAGIIGYHALKRANPPPDARLALLGFGSSAHIVMQIARHRGYQVYVVTRGRNHQRLALEMGAVWVGEDAAMMPSRVDSAILFAPVGTLVPPALEILDRGGTLALAGIHMTDVPRLNYQQHLFYERDIHPVTANTRQDGRELLAEAAKIPIKPRTQIYSLSDANHALRDLKYDRVNGTAVLLV